MIFTRNIIKYGDIKYKIKFAFLPTIIKIDENKGVKTIIWLNLYERKYKYLGDDTGWISTTECRLINKKESD